LLRDSEEWLEIVVDGGRIGCAGAGQTAGDGGGLPGTTGLMSHDFNLAGIEGPSARTIVPYSLSCPYPPRRSQSYDPQKDGL